MQIISFQLWKNNDTNKFIRCITTLLFLFGVSLKLLTAMITDKKLQVVYERIAENWKFFTDKDEIRVLQQHSEIGRILTLSYVLYMWVSVIVFITMPYLPVVIDILFPINGSRPRFYVLDGEYTVDKLEYYNYIYIFESVCSVVTVPIFCTVDSAYACCVEQCVALLAVVSFAQILESSYSLSFLLLMGANLLIVSVGTLVILENLHNPYELTRYTMIFIALMLHMFYLSWPGQELINSSSDIVFDAYNNEWYNCSLRSQKLLRFLMLRAIRPLEITAGGVYVMNIENFGWLAKTSLSYVAVFASFT